MCCAIVGNIRRRHHVEGSRKSVGFGGSRRDYGGGIQTLGGSAGARVEDVTVSSAAADEELRAGAGSRQCLIRKVKFGESLGLPQWMSQADCPAAAIRSRLVPLCENAAFAAVEQVVIHAMKGELFCHSIERITFADAVEVYLNARSAKCNGVQ